MAVQSSEASAPLRVAIIGFGMAGVVFHAPLVAATPGMEVAAIVTGRAERQRQARVQYPQAEIIGDVAELWRQAERYDLIVVATANRAHVPLGLAALQAGLPVVIDKPLAATVADAERLLAVSRERGKLLTVFQNRRWDNDFLTVRKLIATDLLGPITRYESRFERYRPHVNEQAWRESAQPEDAGGLLYDIGSHLIDQALFLFGKPVQVYAEQARRRPNAQVDDDTFVALQFANGVNAHLWASVTTRTPGPRVRISGLHGTYEKWGLDPQEEALRAGRSPTEAGWGTESAERRGRLATEVGGVHIEGAVETEPGAYQYYYALVRDALIAGGEVPVDPGAVIDVLRVIEAAQRSARQGRVVTL